MVYDKRTNHSDISLPISRVKERIWVSRERKGRQVSDLNILRYLSGLLLLLIVPVSLIFQYLKKNTVLCIC